MAVKLNLILVFLCFLSTTLKSQWDAHAGIVAPISENATATASSRDTLAHLILDGDQNTSWESDFSFPFPYLSKQHQNILLNTEDSLFCSSSIKDSIFLDSVVLDTIMVDSFFMDTIVIDSIVIDTFMIDSMFLDTVQIDSIAFDTIQVDSIYFDSTTMTNDTITIDSFVIDTFMIDSIFYDTIVVDSIAFDSMMVDSIFLDSIPIDSTIMDTISLLFNTIDTTDYGVLTDANPSFGNIVFPKSGAWSWLGITMDSIQPVLAISCKAFSQSDIHIYAFTSPADSILVDTYVSGVDDYALKIIEVEEDSVYQIKLWSASDINIFELGGLADYPKESVVVDLGSSQGLGQIVTRYWAGVERAEKSILYISEDSISWYELVHLDPDNSGLVNIQVHIDTTARYLRIEHSLALLDYGRVYVWELGVYDENGIYAPNPIAQPSDKTLHELLGINTLWGWGHNTYSDLIPAGKGPAMFDTISGFARNYHFMDWDVHDPDSIPDYSDMAANGTYPAFAWLDWDREYQAWIDGEVEPHACIMFAHAFPPSAWDNYASAYTYGYEFAKHFGPTQGNGLIHKMEIGNEPWYYTSDEYAPIMSNMAKGIKDADPLIEVFPCALQAHDSITENSIIGLKNYIGTRISPADSSNLDGVNIHAYCWDIDSVGSRVGVMPESRTSEFRSINSMIKWRDVNMPNKKVIVSEWGYDIDSPNEPCIHSECVSERAGAVYTTRAALIMDRLGVDEATIFWFANSVDTSTTFNRSGLLESVNNNFNKKNVFEAVTTLVDSLEHAYFYDVIQEDDDAYIYMYVDSLNQPSHLVAWSPSDGNSVIESNAIWTSAEYVPLHATRVIGEQIGGTPLATPTYSNDTMYLSINSAPTIIRLAPNPCVDSLMINSIGSNFLYSADSTIISDAILPSAMIDSITYQAGQIVKLKSGFKSDGSTNFKAIIEECVIDSLLPLMQRGEEEKY